jgi:hypothetical protein
MMVSKHTNISNFAQFLEKARSASGEAKLVKDVQEIDQAIKDGDLKLQE